MIFAGK
jgi:hypothetical protein